MRVLVIGGSGSLSGPIAAQLRAEGHEVLIFNRGLRENTPPGCVRIKGDRKDLVSYKSRFEGEKIDGVVDSIAYLPKDVEDDLACFASVKHLVLISTVDVYGGDPPRLPTTEAQEPRPLTLYGKSKLATERTLERGARRIGVPFTVFRPSLVIGRGNLVTSIWGRNKYLLDRVRKGKPIPVFDGGRNLLTPVFNADAAWGISRALFNPITFGETYNLSGSEHITHKAFFTKIGEILHRDVRLVSVPVESFSKVYSDQSHLFTHRCFSSRKLEEAIGYDPPHSVTAGLESTIQWMAESGNDKSCDDDPFDDELVKCLMNDGVRLEELLRSRKVQQSGSGGWQARKQEAAALDLDSIIFIKGR